MTSVCIVTNELYPLAPGGIGRLVYNFAVTNAGRPAPVDLHFLLPVASDRNTQQLQDAFDGLATLHYCPASLGALGLLGQSIDAAPVADALDSHMIKSLRYYAGLLEAQRRLGPGGRFDIIEFPDFGGWGAAAVMSKRAGIEFADTCLAVRLHSTFGLIMDAEPGYHEPSDWTGGIHDLERLALHGADRIIAHLPSIADLNQRRYGFDDAWRRRVEIELPPLILTDEEQAALAAKTAGALTIPADPHFLFSARLQVFKRPDLFIRAAVHLLDGGIPGANLFLIVSYGWDNAYVEGLKALVPDRWRQRIRFLDKVSHEERAALLATSIVVIPSDFESLCLLAFEARMLGSPVILNRKCVAFGQEPELWREDLDCLFFDGDFASLAAAMRKALDWTPVPMRPLETPAPYWERAAPAPALEPAAPREQTLGHLVLGYHTPDALAQRLQELDGALGSLHGIHALIPREAIQAYGMARSAWAGSGVTIHPCSWLEPTPTEIELAIRAMSCDLVALVPAGYHVDPSLWQLARVGLSASTEAACFTSHGVDLREGNNRRSLLSYGAAPTVSLIANRVAHRASVLRRQVVLDLGLRETAQDRWLEDLCARLARRGLEVLVAPAALVSFDERSAVPSRLRASRFYGSMRDEASREEGSTWRSSSLVATRDSLPEMTAEEAAQFEARVRKAICDNVRQLHRALQCRRVEMKARSGSADNDYREVEIVAQDLAMGNLQIDWLGFKLARFNGVPQIEFREQQNAAKLFADSWPPETRDQWGPFALLSSAPERLNREFFGRLSDSEYGILSALFTALPGIVDSLGLDNASTLDWLDAVLRLQADAGSLGRTTAPLT